MYNPETEGLPQPAELISVPSKLYNSPTQPVVKPDLCFKGTTGM
jgi:hypothetical protein